MADVNADNLILVVNGSIIQERRDEAAVSGFLALRPAMPALNKIGLQSASHFIKKHGICGKQNYQQSSMDTHHYGDYGSGFPEGEWLGMDNGFIGQDGYDDGLLNGVTVQRTPLYWAFRTGWNPQTGKGIGLRFFGATHILFEAAEDNVYFQPAPGKGLITTGKNAAGGVSYEKTYLSGVSCTGDTLVSLFETTMLDRVIVPYAKFAFCELTVTAASSNYREMYRVWFSWLGGTNGAQANIFDVQNVSTPSGTLKDALSTSVNGRTAVPLVVTDNGGGSNGGQIKVQFRGIANETFQIASRLNVVVKA